MRAEDKLLYSKETCAVMAFAKNAEGIIEDENKLQKFPCEFFVDQYKNYLK